MHAFSGDNARSHHLHPAELFGVDGSLAVQRFTDRRHNPAENSLADRNLGNSAGSFNEIAFLDMDVFTHNRDTHIVLFKVQHQAEDDCTITEPDACLASLPV